MKPKRCFHKIQGKCFHKKYCGNAYVAYGVSADIVDDYVRIGESTAVECLKKFISNIIMILEGE